MSEKKVEPVWPLFPESRVPKEKPKGSPYLFTYVPVENLDFSIQRDLELKAPKGDKIAVQVLVNTSYPHSVSSFHLSVVRIDLKLKELSKKIIDQTEDIRVYEGRSEMGPAGMQVVFVLKKDADMDLVRRELKAFDKSLNSVLDPTVFHIYRA